MIKNVSFEQCIIKWAPIIKLSSNFADCKYLETLIRWGRCWPYGFINNEKNFHDSKYIEKMWLDEYGNLIKINDGNIQILLDHALCAGKITPLYCARAYAHDEHLITLSKRVLIAENLNPKWRFKFFLRKDGFANARLFINNQWENISPLIMGQSMIKWLVEFQDQPGMHVMPDFIRFQVPCAELSAWLYSPTDPNFRAAISTFIEKEKV